MPEGNEISRRTTIGYLLAGGAQCGWLVLLLAGAVLAVATAIFCGIVAAMVGGLIGLPPEWDFMIGLVGTILGVFPVVKVALWVHGRVARPPEKPIEELTEVF